PRREPVGAVEAPVDRDGVGQLRQPRHDDDGRDDEDGQWDDQPDPEECGARAADVVVHGVVSFTRAARVAGATPGEAARATRAWMSWASSARGAADADTTAPLPRRRSIRPSSRSS